MESLFLISFLITLSGMMVQAQPPRLDLQIGLFNGDLKINVKTRNGVLKAQRWPQGIIYYEYGANFNQMQKEMVKGAMAEIENYTCVRFQPRTNQDAYVTIINDTGCYADAGYTGRAQKLSLNDVNGGKDQGCWWHATVVHELLHTVGLWHEQQRKDRDDFVTVDLSTVPEKWQFALTPEQNSYTYNVPYDYTSVMHYNKNAFSNTTGAITIMPKDARYLPILGQAKHGSQNDWLKVNRIYECTNVPAYDPSINPSCYDLVANCADFAKRGDCDNNPRYMAWNCYPTCYPWLCSGTQRGSPDCVDDDALCDAWAKNGDCTRNPGYMLIHCKKSCRQC